MLTLVLYLLTVVLSVTDVVGAVMLLIVVMVTFSCGGQFSRTVGDGCLD